MRFLVCEDDYITSQVMLELMLAFGRCDLAEDGRKAVDLFDTAMNEQDPYTIIFLDIMMPELDGQGVLFKIREIENAHGIIGLDASKIIMTTALDDYQNIKTAFNHQADGYLVKPVEKDKIIELLNEFGMIAI